MRMFSIVAFAGLVTSATPAIGDPPPVALRDQLLARAGKTPIYLTSSDAGLQAKAADGAWSAPLVAGPVDAAALDAAQDLVWLVRAGRLDVLDLREPSPKPVPIVERWYKRTETYVSAPVVSVTGVSNASTDTTYSGVYPILSWKGGKTTITTGEGAYGGIWEDQDAAVKKAIRRAKIVGAAWLAAQAERKPRVVTSPAGSAKPPRVKLPRGMGECEDADLCGDAKAFGPTGCQIVVVSHACGDACHTSCVLHDPATKKFASPTAPGAWGKKAEPGACMGYVFDASGTRYLAGDHVCTMKSCTALEGATAFAWLDR